MNPKPITQNTLFFGDNLHILREHIPFESVDLIYLDPPFNSKRNYNIFMKTPKGIQSDAQITAFEDTWHWGEQAEQEYSDLLRQGNTDVAELLSSLRRFLKESDMMAYLVMMSTRLLEMHKVLKPTGSLYLHCDPTASHYLKIVLDNIFGPHNYQSEVIWKRTTAHNDPKRWGNIHDTLLFYSKTETFLWNPIFTEHSEEYKSRFRNIDPDGRHWSDDNLSAKGLSGGGYTYEYKGTTSLWRVPLETMKKLDDENKLHFTNKGGIRLKRYLEDTPGVPIQDVITDIFPINSQAQERLGYPTQKPQALLERIIQASSNPGDVVLDPFCGCGTAIHAAEKLDRKWLGIDITHLSIHLVERRMKKAFPSIQFNIHGEPEDLDSARDLAIRDKYEFQFWACSMVGAQPYRGGKKGADFGTDGIIYFQDDKSTAKKIIVSVKGGDHVTRTMIADLKNTVEREGAQLGFFVTLVDPTEPMRVEAVSAGFYESQMGKFQKIQIITIADLMNGKKPHYPDLSMGGASFKKPKIEEEDATQDKLL